MLDLTEFKGKAVFQFFMRTLMQR